MLLPLKNLLTPQELQTAQSLLGEDAPWIDGRSSAGAQALMQKNNQQLLQSSAAAHSLQALILAALQREFRQLAWPPA